MFSSSETSPSSPVRSTRIDSPTSSPTRRFEASKRRLERKYSDRFIPSRAGTDFAQLYLPNVGNSSSLTSEKPEESQYALLLRSEITQVPEQQFPDQNTAPGHEGSNVYRSLYGSPPGSPPVSRNTLRYRSPLPTRASERKYCTSPISERGRTLLVSPTKTVRKIQKTPFRVLEVPQLQDDFYLNLLDWSSTNLVAVGLRQSACLWNAITGQVTHLSDLHTTDNSICSVQFHSRGNTLAVGLNSGEVQIWDAITLQCLSTLNAHRVRVGTLAWNADCLTSGGRDKTIMHHDTRNGMCVAKMTAHKQEVCGLKWSPDGSLLASGGNDNKLFVWNLAKPSTPEHSFAEHIAAVKAVAWSPHQRGILGSGGGTADKCIKIWNTQTSSLVSSTDTGSQVCNLMWSRTSNELVSTHGYSQNQVVIWNHPTMSEIAALSGHTYRVLYLAMSPDGQTVVTGAGDESLRFWNVFPASRANPTGDRVSSLAAHSDIR